DAQASRRAACRGESVERRDGGRCAGLAVDVPKHLSGPSVADLPPPRGAAPQVDDRVPVDLNGQGRTHLGAGFEDACEGPAQGGECRLAEPLDGRSAGRHVAAMMAQNDVRTKPRRTPVLLMPPMA